MNRRLTITLPEIEKKALHDLAEAEFRDTPAQAAMIIHQELERRGLLMGEEFQPLKCGTQILMEESNA